MDLMYVTFVNLFHESNRGVHNKIISQCWAFEKLYASRVFYTTIVYETAELLYGKKLIERVPVTDGWEYCETVLNWIMKYDVNFLYLRYHFCNQNIYSFCKLLKKLNKPVIMEIPSYPYDDELQEGLCKFEDSLYREKMAEFVGTFTTYSYDEMIWNRPCIQLINGIDSSKICFNSNNHTNANSIRFIAVLTMNPWHGMERIIFGFYKYYKEKKELDPDINLVLIGDGVEKGYYERLVKIYELDNYIYFEGVIDSYKLKDYYREFDIAVSSLAMYKIGVDYASPIKGSEYCANGLPMICGYKDSRFEKAPFVYQLSNDDSVINIKSILDWYKGLAKDFEFKKKICEYAAEKLTWEKIMIPVVEDFKKL